MRLAHLSDLHIGKSDRHTAAVLALRQAIAENGVDHTVVTGDITEHGTRHEFDLFKSAFKDLLDRGRLTLVPGNHDRLNDEAAKEFMDGRLKTVALPGFRLVAVDTTGPHNRWRYAGHGKLTIDLISQILDAVRSAAATDFVAVAMHHHLLPLPEDLWAEWFSELFHLPFASELKLGRKLLEELKGHCDAVLHGHRHAATEKHFATVGRGLALFNAGSSTKLGRFRLFETEDGGLARPPSWIAI